MSYRRDASDVMAAVLGDAPAIITSRQNMRHWDPDMAVQGWEKIRNRMTDLIVANADAVAAECELVEQLPRGKVVTVRNGIPMPHRSERSGALRRELGLPQDCAIVGNVANLKPGKAHDMLLTAVARAVSNAPNFHLVICGADYGRLGALIGSSGSAPDWGHA